MTALTRLAWRLASRLPDGTDDLGHRSGPLRRLALWLVVRAIESGGGSRVFAIRSPKLGAPFHW